MHDLNPVLVRRSWALLASLACFVATLQLARTTSVGAPMVIALIVIGAGAIWSVQCGRSVLSVTREALGSLQALLLRLSPREHHVLDWTVFVAGLGVAGIGVVAGIVALAFVGVAVVAGFVAVRAPELMVVGLVVAGGVKGAPWLAGVPVDLTLVAWLGTLFALALRSLRPGMGIPRFPVGMLLALPLVVLVVASALWSLDEAAGAAKALRFELITMTALVAPVVLIRTRAALVRASIAFVVFGLVIALTAVRTTNLGEPLAAAGGNQIQAALYPAIGIVCICTYLAVLTRGKWLLVVLLPLVILLPATFAAGSRGVLIAAVVVALYVAGRAVLLSKRKALVLGGIASAVVALFLVWPYLAGGAADRYQRQLFSADVGQVLGDRGYLYERGASLAASNPIGGVGAGGFAYASIVYEENQYPHNIFLEFASEQGIVAAGLFGMLVIAAWRVRRRAPLGPRSPETLVSGALILLFLSEAMVSFDINENRGLWFALGLAFALPGFAGENDTRDAGRSS